MDTIIMAPVKAYNPETDIPDLSGKVIFITGGTAGLGRSTIAYLAQHNPAAIHFSGRNGIAGHNLITELLKTAPGVVVKFYQCDQTSLASVEEAAHAFLKSGVSRLDVLVCNAGVMGGPPNLTKDGYEIQFGINYLSHALLTKLFTPILQATASAHGEARLVNLTSAGYAMHNSGVSFADLKTTQESMGMLGMKQWARYGQSKFAQVLYTGEYAKRYPDITAVAIHPGVVHTNLVEGLPLRDRIFIKMMTMGQAVQLEEGAWNTCWAATARKEEGVKSGEIYWPVGVPKEKTKAAGDEGLWRELWEWTERELGAY
ncbi:dehydrogenase with different specificitie, partial [Phaeosphaeria sp. MPI-PUGE-AT-0046c]